MSRKQQYQKNKSAKVGDELICPVCGKPFTKKQWQQAFCCSKCKERYWNDKGDRHKDPNYYHKYNKKHPERYAGLLGIGATRAEIEHNKALYMYHNDENFRRYVKDVKLNYDGSWDEHACGNTLSEMYANYISNHLC